MADFLPPDSVPRSEITQAGAVPYRIGSNGAAQVCLVTSTAGYWSLPKGTIEPGDTPEETAVTESFEEAGLIGVVAEPALGVWRYVKYGSVTHVLMYPMLVTDELDTWLEHHRRDRRWEPIEQAIRVTERPGMDAAVRALAERIAYATARQSA